MRWRSAPIPRGAYPCADGHSWAEPDLEHAAVLAGYRERLSFASVGARYRARLEQLWAAREDVGARLRWRADRSPVGW